MPIHQCDSVYNQGFNLYMERGRTNEALLSQLYSHFQGPDLIGQSSDHHLFLKISGKKKTQYTSWKKDSLGLSCTLRIWDDSVHFFPTEITARHDCQRVFKKKTCAVLSAKVSDEDLTAQ